MVTIFPLTVAVALVEEKELDQGVMYLLSLMPVQSMTILVIPGAAMVTLEDL